MEAQSTLFESEQGASLKWLPIERLHPHPNNPRIEYDAETVKGIAHTLKKSGHFDESHALLVRPDEDSFEIVSGHHRWQAAKRAQLEEVPCWVRRMDDKEALLELRAQNTQSELSPLEEGRNICDAIGMPGENKGGAGNKGGLRDYCRRLDLERKTEELKQKAWSVVEKVGTRVPTLRPLKKKHRHLHEISKAPEPLWEPLVKELIDSDWSVRDTKHYRQKVEEFEVREPWSEVFLPEAAVVSTYLSTGEFSPQTVERLCDLAESTEQRIQSYDVDASSFLEDFREWLRAEAGTRAEGSWDPRQIKKYQREIQAELERAEQEARKSWVNSGWREAISDLDSSGARLVLTDPPYGIDYQSDRRTDRRKDRRHDAIDGDSEGAASELQDCMEALHPKLNEDAHLLVFSHWRTEPKMRKALLEAGYELRGSLIWAKNQRGMGDRETTFAPKHERILHAVKGSPVLFDREPDVLEADKIASDRHPTEKPIPLLERLIECTTAEGEKVLDPFGGVASTLVAGLKNNRRVWGAEIDSGYYTEGKHRIESLR